MLVALVAKVQSYRSALMNEQKAKAKLQEDYNRLQRKMDVQLDKNSQSKQDNNSVQERLNEELASKEQVSVCLSVYV